MLKNKSEMFKSIMPFVVVILVALFIRAFVFAPVAVKGSSMEPNFSHGDILIVNKLSYKLSEPKKDDIVICEYITNKMKEKNIIKRVIGVPGDIINFEDVIKGDDFYLDLYLNNNFIEEDYILEPNQQKGNTEYPYTVPENSYFVMGDNRNASSDSREQEIGAIKKQDITGKVAVRIYPFNKFSFIK